MSVRINASSGVEIVGSAGTLFHELGRMHRDYLGVTSSVRRVEEIKTIRQYENRFTGYNRKDHTGTGIWPQ